MLLQFRKSLDMHCTMQSWHSRTHKVCHTMRSGFVKLWYALYHASAVSQEPCRALRNAIVAVQQAFGVSYSALSIGCLISMTSSEAVWLSASSVLIFVVEFTWHTHWYRNCRDWNECVSYKVSIPLCVKPNHKLCKMLWQFPIWVLE